MHCPRCGAPFSPATTGGVEHHRCIGCGSAWVPMRSLESLLIALAPEEPLDLTQPMPALDDPGGGLRCPSCARTMSHGGYLEQRYVRIDRCLSCAALFTDPGELEAMAEQRVRVENGRKHGEENLNGVLSVLKTLHPHVR